ncbi:uncharacterized protein P174DRAFT_437043 [Aspergillus novofumigatus IBT 16806]|uniref:Uncharacterized protein n=1 Tax=Aspergillus novofumigatus (strain IBT 16806) TaxID=1392255 RepID=A0A2I1CLX2_ASPN1|nr:uncharacterized protein P174DRAFT_437043 [Aspergillus novofumigatus IBT 16806]PKX98623.1 hypothetical protein P174DRAFT_437043 [Aspergillus novofumigatus IBT 16806]
MSLIPFSPYPSVQPRSDQSCLSNVVTSPEYQIPGSVYYLTLQMSEMKLVLSTL